jgi:hypothetical protein
VTLDFDVMDQQRNIRLMSSLKRRKANLKVEIRIRMDLDRLGAGPRGENLTLLRAISIGGR